MAIDLILSKINSLQIQASNLTFIYKNLHDENVLFILLGFLVTSLLRLNTKIREKRQFGSTLRF